MGGLGNYLKVPSNRLDMLIVITSYASLAPGADSFAVLRILRMFRTLRIARALYKYETIARMLNTAFSSTGAIANVGIFIIFGVGCFGIVGMQLFAHQAY